MITWHESGVRTIEEAKKKTLAIGATGASSPSVLYPTVANNLFGTQFRIISGYPGGGDIMPGKMLTQAHSRCPTSARPASSASTMDG